MLTSHFNYWMVILLVITGLYVVMTRGNLVKKIIGLNLLQVGVILFYITLGKVEGGTAPILLEHSDHPEVYSNPVPHVLMLTAIVVGIAVTAMALALVVRIYEEYGTIEEDEILAIGGPALAGSASPSAAAEAAGPPPGSPLPDAPAPPPEAATS